MPSLRDPCNAHDRVLYDHWQLDLLRCRVVLGIPREDFREQVLVKYGKQTVGVVLLDTEGDVTEAEKRMWKEPRVSAQQQFVYGDNDSICVSGARVGIERSSCGREEKKYTQNI